jgi:DHA1 family bicyclomycin/chloramphenicol resistance-like MFS transporter
MGHLAGTAASVIGAISTVAAVAIAVPVGQAFDGTPVPVILGVLVCTGLSLVLMRGLREASAAGMARPGA